MSKAIQSLTLVIMTIFSTGCGSIEGAAQKLVDALDDNDSSYSSDGENQDEDSTGDNESDDEVISDDDRVTYTGTMTDDEDTGGGITVLEPAGYEFTDDRFFLGTYETNGTLGYDYMYGERCQNQYNFPSVIRGYSHYDDDFIDFETSQGSLAWVAELYPDETFDFTVRFLDDFGHPSVDLACTCSIEEGYGNYYPDEIVCNCSGSDNDVCGLTYEKMSD